MIHKPALDASLGEACYYGAALEDASVSEIMVNPDKAEAARALNPLSERQIFGKSIFLFDGVDRSRLAGLGEMHKPSIVDLFVATMKGTYA